MTTNTQNQLEIYLDVIYGPMKPVTEIRGASPSLLFDSALDHPPNESTEYPHSQQGQRRVPPI